MNNVLKLLYSSFLHTCAVFLAPRRDKLVSYGSIPAAVLFILNLIVFLPSFFAGTFAATVFFVVTTILLQLLNAVSAYRLFKKYSDSDRLETLITKTSINNNEFIYYFKNDYVFNLITVLFFGLSFAFFQLFCYLLLFFTGAVSIGAFFLISFIFLAAVCFAAMTGGTIFYLVKREKKRSFFEVSRLLDFNLTAAWFLPLIFTAVFLALFTPVLFLSRPGVLWFLFCFCAALFCTAGTHLFCSFFDLYESSSRNFFIHRSIKRITIVKRVLRNLYKRKIYPRISYFYPIAALFGGYYFFTEAANFMEKMFLIKTDLLVIIFQTAVFMLLFTYPYILLLFKKERKVKQPFLFTSFLFFILLLHSFLIKVNIIIPSDSEAFFTLFEGFIAPFIEAFNRYTYFLHGLFLKISPLSIILLPVFFFILFYVNYLVFYLTRIFESFIDYHIQKSLYRKSSNMIFGDSLSLYPFMFVFCMNVVLLFVLKLELPALSRFLSATISTLQVGQIFKIEFLKDENIHTSMDFIFNILFLCTAGYCGVNIVSRLFSSLFSHFILVDDELVYLKNTLIHKTVLRIPLAKINYIVFKQNIAERFLDIGTVYIETVDTKGMIKIQGITSIKEKNILIMDKIKSGLQKV